jgi:hypothetical protein
MNITKNNKPCSPSLADAEVFATSSIDFAPATREGGSSTPTMTSLALMTAWTVMRQFQLVRRLIGDRRALRRTTDIDANMGRGLALLDLGDGSLELIAR